jgi:hypothetical protein
MRPIFSSASCDLKGCTCLDCSTHGNMDDVMNLVSCYFRIIDSYVITRSDMAGRCKECSPELLVFSCAEVLAVLDAFRFRC